MKRRGDMQPGLAWQGQQSTGAANSGSNFGPGPRESIEYSPDPAMQHLFAAAGWADAASTL